MNMNFSRNTFSRDKGSGGKIGAVFWGETHWMGDRGVENGTKGADCFLWEVTD